MKYYTAEEVQFHNSEDDCWISIFSNVYDITSLISKNRGFLAQPLIEYAGTNISHWFKQDKNDEVSIRTYIDPKRNIEMPFTPYGRFIHVPSPDPAAIPNIIDIPWWNNKEYIVGLIDGHIVELDMLKTLEENGIPDESEKYMKLGLEEDFYIPTIHIYFNDDLTYA
eukprot:gene20639-26758_t